MADDSQSRAYAHLPEDLIRQILMDVPNTVNKINEMFVAEEKPMAEAMGQLRNKYKCIHTADDKDHSDSVVAVDGGHVIEKMAGIDTILVAAVGVAGLTKHTAPKWENQFLQWQEALPHEEATPRLCQGAMFIMELTALADAANTGREICIMDGAHFTPILKINSMLSANEEHAGDIYIDSLRKFLKEKFDKIIPDIPNIIDAAFKKEEIIAMPKYSSSRDVLDGIVKSGEVKIDDKAFFSLQLKENEYVGPFSAGQSQEECRKIWSDLHIRCNLEIPEKDELNARLDNVINFVRARHANDGRGKKESSIWYTYYKPYGEGLAYRIECKAGLAKDTKKFHRMLASIKRQIVYPDILEPFPQYLADLMAKSVSGGMGALQDAVRLSPQFNIDKLRLFLRHRSK